jgi:hypothetical protein
MLLNRDRTLLLQDGKPLAAGSLTIGSQGATWTLTPQGPRPALRTLYLVVGYKAGVA